MNYLRRREIDFGDKESSMTSVTRLGDLLHFGQIIKAYGNN